MRVLLTGDQHAAHADWDEGSPLEVGFVRGHGGPAPSPSVRSIIKAQAHRHAPRSLLGAIGSHPGIGLLARRSRPRLGLRAFPAGLDLVQTCGTWDMFAPEVDWLVDTEHAGALFGYSPHCAQDRRWQQMVERELSSDNCRAVLAWSDAAHRSIVSQFSSEAIRRKVRVVRPTCGPLRAPTRRKGRRPTILFVGRGYWGKGGFLLLRALARLKSRWARVVMITEPGLERLPASVDGIELEIIPPRLDRQTLIRDVFSDADLFCVPTLSDTFGYVFMEAMASGLPVIAASTHGAVSELVSEGRTGLLIKPPFQIFGDDGAYEWTYREFVRLIKRSIRSEAIHSAAGELADRLDELLTNRSLRNSMADEAYSEFTGRGRFSLEVRRNLYRDLYTSISRP